MYSAPAPFPLAGVEENAAAEEGGAGLFVSAGGTEDLKALQKRVPDSIIVLDMTDCVLSSKAVELLLLIVRLQRKIETLILQNTQLTHRQANTVVSRVLELPCLTGLDVSQNKLTRTSVRYILDALRGKSCVLQYLNLGGGPGKA